MPASAPRRPLRALSLACALALALPAAFAADGVPPPKGVTAGPCVEGLCEYGLANGLRVLLYPDASTPKVTVNIVYDVGSVDENYGETGMAHLLEHLMFKGTPTHVDIPGEMQKRGIEKNASTWLDRTNYYGTFPADTATLDWVLGMEADRMVHSNIAKKDLDSEMTVVRNEMEAGENSPVGVTLERIRSTAYLWHNYGKDTIGARSDVEHVPIERLQAFYRTWYRPDNATLVVAGRFDAAATLAKIQTLFGAIPKPKTALPVSYTVEPTQDGEREVVVRRTGDLRVIGIAWHAAPATHPDSAALAVLMNILGDTPTGRLHKALVETKLAANAFAFDEALREGGLFTAMAIVPKDGDVAKVQDTLLREIEALAQRPVTAAEVADAQRRLANGFDDTAADANRLGMAMTSSIADGDWRLYFLQRDRIAKVTADDVNRVAKAYFKPSNRTIGRFEPTAAPDRAEIATAPSAAAALQGYVGRVAEAAGETFDTSAANIDKRTETFTLGDGLKVSLLRKDTRGDKVRVNATFRFGDVEALRAVPPMAASFAGSLLMNGSETMSREEIAKRFEALKTSVSINAGTQSAGISLDTRRETLAQALALAADVLRHPAYPASEFEQQRLQWSTGMEASRQEPGSVASQAMGRHFDPWPAGHPFAFRSLDQSLADLRALRREDVVAFHRAFYGTAAGEIAIVGDFDPAEVKAQLKALFADWRSPKPYRAELETYRAVAAERQRIETPDKANAVLLARLNLALNQDDPDYPALVIANRILGGDPLKARLADRLRQKDGLTYGVGSDIGFGTERGENAGLIVIQAIAAPENMARLETGVREELARLVKDGVTEQELRDAVQSLRTEREQWRGDDGAMVGILARNLYLGRTMAWWEAADAKLASLTAAQVNEVLRRRIDPSTLSVYEAGDFAKAEKK
ncbi:MAG: M16 family metallopeptidase [Lysobacteraceae bacterium]